MQQPCDARENLRERAQQRYLGDDRGCKETSQQERAIRDNHPHVALVERGCVLAAGDFVELGMLPPSWRSFLLSLSRRSRRRRYGCARCEGGRALRGPGELAHGGALLGGRILFTVMEKAGLA